MTMKPPSIRSDNYGTSSVEGYILAKLEEIHADVIDLKTHVDNLRQESAGKRAVSKFVISALAIIGATVGWLVDNAVSVAQHIQTQGDVSP